MISRLFQLLWYGHVHHWRKMNTWSYKDQRCEICGKTAYSSDIDMRVTEWNQK